MNNVRMNAIGSLYGLGFVLGLVGVVFLGCSAGQSMSDKVWRYAAPGYVCLGIGAVFVLTASILAFLAGAPASRESRGGDREG